MIQLPELTFASADPEQMAIDVVGTVEGLLGRTLARADPLRLFLRGIEAIIIQQRLLIDKTAKDNLLAYATGDNLDHLGLLVGCQRLTARAAVTTLEVKLSAPREQVTTVRQGTRVTAGDEVYFATDEALIFAAGETSKQVKATCTQTGVIGNGYTAGELSRIVDPQAFVQSITNVTTSEGGADIESDDSYRERIHEAPEKFSDAGSEGSYAWLAKSASQLIVDVAVDSPAPGEVDVYPLLEGGELPQTEMLALVDEVLNAKTVRPLTDKVTVKPPTVANYNIDLTYYISRSDATNSEAIQAAAEKAVDAFIDWQCAALGRDINDTELRYRLRKAGVKRVDVREPAFTATDKFTVALANDINVIFGGLEED